MSDQSGARWVVLVTDDQGADVVIGPVRSGWPLDNLRLEIDGYGWNVRGTARFLSADSFADLRRRGDGGAIDG